MKDIDELIEWLATEHPDAVLIGDKEERRNYLPAVIGFDRNSGGLVYSREKLIECYVKYNGMSYEEAVEWIEYNVDRSLPYQTPHAPIIMDELP